MQRVPGERVPPEIREPRLDRWPRRPVGPPLGASPSACAAFAVVLFPAPVMCLARGGLPGADRPRGWSSTTISVRRQGRPAAGRARPRVRRDRVRVQAEPLAATGALLHWVTTACSCPGRRRSQRLYLESWLWEAPTRAAFVEAVGEPTRTRRLPASWSCATRKPTNRFARAARGSTRRCPRSRRSRRATRGPSGASGTPTGSGGCSTPATRVCTGPRSTAAAARRRPSS